MNRFKATRQFVVTLSLSLLFIALAVFLVPRSTVQALDNVSIYYVAPSCAGVPAPCFTSIQAAVDAADEPTDVVKVAAGVYSGIQQQQGITQVVYISKTLVLKGGYTLANWIDANPVDNPTVVDAQNLGRVIVITNTHSVTIEGFTIANGNATGLGDFYFDEGGGLYIAYSTNVLINGCIIQNSVASTETGAKWAFGGGMSVIDSTGEIRNNLFVDNTTGPGVWGGRGGGMHSAGAITITGDVFSNNTATDGGGGMYIEQAYAVAENAIEHNSAGNAGGGVWISSAYVPTLMRDNLIADNTAINGGGIYNGGKATTFIHNTFYHNSALQEGGGIYAVNSNNDFIKNRFESNTAVYGGGIFHIIGRPTLIGNVIVSNTATEGGGATIKWVNGGYDDYTTPFFMANNVVANNYANNGSSSSGSALWIHGGQQNPTLGVLLHNTIANNRRPGAAVFASDYTTLSLTNTIVAGNAIGFSIITGTPVSLVGTLWHGNGADVVGAAAVISYQQVFGDPVFVNPATGDYHIGPSSAAIDRGIRTNIFSDIDGEPRVNTPDLGADEYWAPGALKQINLPVVFKP
jgi:hypothetical protein